MHQSVIFDICVKLGARYTFMTGVSCSSELCGRMALLFECSFSRFCKKPLLLRPSRMTVLLEARLTRVLQRQNIPLQKCDVDLHSLLLPTRVHSEFSGKEEKKKAVLSSSLIIT